MGKTGLAVVVIILAILAVIYLQQSPATLNETVEKASQDISSNFPKLPSVLQQVAPQPTVQQQQEQQQVQQGKPFTGRVVDISIPWGSSKSDSQLNFSPALVRINVGDTVTWTNEDDERHTVTSGSKFDKQWGTIFDSGIITAKQKYSFTFTEIGDYPYLCALHPWMQAGIQVR